MSLPSTLEYFTARRTQKDDTMTKLHEVPFAVAPTEFNDLEAGSHTLKAPFFSGDAEGGALQVGLQPDEYSANEKEELTVTVSGELGHRAIALARADERPFTIENSDDGHYRDPILSRPVAKLIVAESLKGVWLGVEADGEESLDVDAAGLNYLTHILAQYTLRKQKALREQASTHTDLTQTH